MEYVQEPPVLSAGQRSVVTLGKFNGLHRGHQKLISRVRRAGEEFHWLKTVYSFSGNDRRILTREERIDLLRRLGIDLYIDARLDKQLMHMEPEDFVRRFLVDCLHTALVVVGPDYRFGYQRKGTAQILRDYGRRYDFQVEILEKEKEGPRVISSTYVKEQLNEGHMEKVNRLLGYPFSVSGQIIHGRGLGHTIGIPTANMRPPREKLMPLNGVYITRSWFTDHVYTGVTNVGYKPTVGGEEFLGVETYLLDCREDLYGRCARVEFYKFLRPERRFPSIGELKAQMDRDIEAGRDWERTVKN